MINSDNVVRGGLTPKLKDVKTLLEILPYFDTKERLVLSGDVKSESPKCIEYSPEGFLELNVTRVELLQGQSHSLNFPYCATMLVLEGCGGVEGCKSEIEQYSTWYLLPSWPVSIKATSEKMTIFVANPK